MALMLILLGWLNLRAFKRSVADVASIDHSVHEHVHQHGDYIHRHAHAHDPERHRKRKCRQRAWIDSLAARSFTGCFGRSSVGVVHGLAGSAAVTLLVLPIIRDPLWAMMYLLIFGVGTIAGMMLVTAAVAAPITYSANRFRAFNHYVAAAAGVLSLIFGIYLVYQIGFVDGLFR